MKKHKNRKQASKKKTLKGKDLSRIMAGYERRAGTEIYTPLPGDPDWQ